MRAILFIGLLGFTQITKATIFETQHLRFSLPDGFVCQNSEGVHTCQSHSGAKMKDAILVVAVKPRGPQDTLEQYASHLSQPRSVQAKGKVPQLSQVVFAKQVQLNGVQWVEARHIASEISEYTTTYWATAQGRLAMLISYSAHSSRKSVSTKEADIIRQSLFVKAPPNGPNLSQGGVNPGPLTGPSGSSSSSLDEQKSAEAFVVNVGGFQLKKMQLALLGVLVIALGVLVRAIALKR